MTPDSHTVSNVAVLNEHTLLEGAGRKSGIVRSLAKCVERKQCEEYILLTLAQCAIFMHLTFSVMIQFFPDDESNTIIRKIIVYQYLMSVKSVSVGIYLYLCQFRNVEAHDCSCSCVWLQYQPARRLNHKDIIMIVIRVCSTVSSMLSGLETRSLGLNTLGTT